MSEYTNSGVYTRGGEEIEFHYNTTLTIRKKAEFINNIVSVVVDDNYFDFLVDVLFDYEIIEKFTDVDLTTVKESYYQLDEIENLLGETNIVEIVKENAVPFLIDNLRSSVEKAIEYKTGIHKNLFSESITSIIKTLDKKISEIDVNDMMEMAKMISTVPGEFTADKILDAYSKSDMYKKNQKKANASRKKRNAMIDELKVVDGNNNVGVIGNGNVVKNTSASVAHITTPILSPTFEV